MVLLLFLKLNKDTWALRERKNRKNQSVENSFTLDMLRQTVYTDNRHLFGKKNMIKHNF